MLVTTRRSVSVQRTLSVSSTEHRSQKPVKHVQSCPSPPHPVCAHTNETALSTSPAAFHTRSTYEAVLVLVDLVALERDQTEAVGDELVMQRRRVLVHGHQVDCCARKRTQKRNTRAGGS